MAPVGPRKPPERKTDQGPQAPHRHRHGWIVGWPCHSRGRHSGSGRSARSTGPLARTYPLLRHIFADGGYGGPKLRGAIEKIGRWTIQIVKRSDTAIGFEVIPRRWVVERTFAWLGRCRRMAKDWEKTIASAEAWLLIAHIRRVTRMLARQ